MAVRPTASPNSTSAAISPATRPFLAQEGWSNLSIRMMVIRGDLDMAAIMDACADLELWPDFDTMLEAYEEAADG